MHVIDLPIETPRLSIDRFQLADAPVLAAYRSDPDVARWQSWSAPYSEEQATAFIESMADSEVGRPGDRINLAIRNGGEVIGDVYLHVLADTPHVAEIGITLAGDAQGQGLATEALGGFVDALLANRHLAKVIAHVDIANTASLALCDRIGLQREGHLSHSVRRDDGSFSDEILFGLVTVEFDE